MQTLGVAGGSSASEGILRRLFFPTIRNDADVDLAVRRGLWVCIVCAGATALLALTLPVLWLEVAFLILAGMGSRMRSRFAAVAVFLVYLTGMLRPRSFGITGVIICGLLLANLRATWLAKSLQPADWSPIVAAREMQSLTLGPDGRPLPLPWTDRMADIWVPTLWPVLRVLFYLLVVVEALGFATLALGAALR